MYISHLFLRIKKKNIFTLQNILCYLLRNGPTRTFLQIQSV